MKISRVGEKLLFYKVKKNDREAFIKAYDLYIDQLYRFVYFKVGSKEEAEDLCSAVFLKTWNYLLQNSLKEEKTLKALLYKIARNSIIDHYRRTAKHETVSLNAETAGGLADLPDHKADQGRLLEAKADLLVVESKLPQLKDEYREVIILRFINEFSIKEIAEILNKSKGNVRVLIFRALNALKELLDQDQLRRP